MSETAALADVILPTSSYLEDEGTVTNVEGALRLEKQHIHLNTKESTIGKSFVK